MILKDKVSFDSSDCKVEIPKKYVDKFRNIIFIPSTYFKCFNYCSAYNIEFPTIKDYMELIGLGEKDYIVFGESLGYGWSDAGCNFLYAVATNISLTNEQSLEVLDKMWRQWQLNHAKDGLIITNGSSRYIDRTDQRTAFFSGYHHKCAYTGLIVLDRLSKDTYDCYLQDKRYEISRDELIMNIQKNNVLNAKATVMKNGKVRLSIKSVDDYIY